MWLGVAPHSFNFSKMLTDENEDLDDTEAACLSDFIESAELSEQEWDFDAQALDTWERRCGQKSNAPVLEAGRKPST